jgi:NADH-quinone oxidoreductase subunit H
VVILSPTPSNQRFFAIWTSLLKTIALLGIILGFVSYTVYAERKICAFIQDRVGPNRVGLPLTLLGFKKDIPLLGLGQPIADAVKLLLKENFIPNSVNKFYYYIAPKLAMIPPILVLAVLPFGSSLFGVPMVIADINVVLYVFLSRRLHTGSCRRLGLRIRNTLPRRHSLKLPNDLHNWLWFVFGNPGFPSLWHPEAS